MWQLCAIVRVLRRVMKYIRHQFSVCHVITPQFVGHNLSRNSSIIFQQPREETLSRSTIATLLEKNIDDVTILVSGSPQIALDTIYLNKNFV
jgi:hypothetical protein